MTKLQIDVDEMVRLGGRGGRNDQAILRGEEVFDIRDYIRHDRVRGHFCGCNIM